MPNQPRKSSPTAKGLPEEHDSDSDDDEIPLYDKKRRLGDSLLLKTTVPTSKTPVRGLVLAAPAAVVLKSRPAPDTVDFRAQCDNLLVEKQRKMRDMERQLAKNETLKAELDGAKRHIAVLSRQVDEVEYCLETAVGDLGMYSQEVKEFLTALKKEHNNSQISSAIETFLKRDMRRPVSAEQSSKSVTFG